MKKLLLTAFEPFDGRALNASQEIARALQPSQFEGAEVERLELPVERFRAPQLVLEAVERFQPDIIVLLGEAKNRAAITPERVAINVDDFAIPDNAGNQPREEIIVAGGPAAYFSTLPLAPIRATLEREGIPAAISNTAGTYLCNHLFYRVMHHLSETNTSTRAGFIHIPVFAEKETFTLPRETILKGVQIALQTCLQQKRW